MDKIAFLILAHTDEKQLNRLISALDYEKFDIYIHLDLKSNIKILYKPCKCRLFVIQNRYDVKWGRISVVEATFAMYKQAINTEKYIRFVTLSGLDYPLLSNKDIYDVLSNNGKEFICGHKLEKTELLKVDLNFECSLFMFKVKSRLMKSDIYYSLRKILLFNRHKTLKKCGRALDIYFAPQWHALSYDFVNYMMNELNENKAIINFFSKSFAPDELLIPTIFFNSPYNAKGYLVPSNSDYMSQCVTHELYYGSDGIYVYKKEDFAKLLNSKKMFCRKVKSGISDELLDKLDEIRKNGHVVQEV